MHNITVVHVDGGEGGIRPRHWGSVGAMHGRPLRRGVASPAPPAGEVPFLSFTGWFFASAGFGRALLAPVTPAYSHRREQRAADCRGKMGGVYVVGM